MRRQLIETIFRDKRQYRLFSLLSLSSIFSISLVLFRDYYVHYDFSQIQNLTDFKDQRGTYGTFFFLIWNLILAWMPYWIALTLEFFTRRRPNASVVSIGFLLISWLLFFPNAPYIVTDLLHLHDRLVVPHWFDTMMFVSFAWTGLLLGYCSLFEVHRFLDSRFPKRFSWIFIVGAIWLGGFGVYMGRFQRWNSWSVLTNPFGLLRQQIHVLMNPFDYLATLGVAVVLSSFMLIGYLTLGALQSETN